MTPVNPGRERRTRFIQTMKIDKTERKRRRNGDSEPMHFLTKGKSGKRRPDPRTITRVSIDPHGEDDTRGD